MLAAPYYRVELGDYLITSPHAWEVVSSRLAPTTATLRLPAQAIPDPPAGSPMTIWQGYRGHGEWMVLTGAVRRVSTEGDELIIHGSDPMAPVARHRVSRAFTGATPQEVIRWLLSQAGVTQYRISSRPYPPLSRFVAEGTVGQVMAAITAAWGLTADWYWLPDVGVWWGPPEESPRASKVAAAITYGRNMLDHRVEPGAKRGRLTMPAAPIYHSNLILVSDPRWWTGQRQLRVDRVIYRARPAEVTIEWSDPAAS